MTEGVGEKFRTPEQKESEPQLVRRTFNQLRALALLQASVYEEDADVPSYVPDVMRDSILAKRERKRQERAEGPLRIRLARASYNWSRNDQNVYELAYFDNKDPDDCFCMVSVTNRAQMRDMSDRLVVDISRNNFGLVDEHHPNRDILGEDRQTRLATISQVSKDSIYRIASANSHENIKLGNRLALATELIRKDDDPASAEIMAYNKFTGTGSNLVRIAGTHEDAYLDIFERENPEIPAYSFTFKLSGEGYARKGQLLLSKNGDEPTYPTGTEELRGRVLLSDALQRMNHRLELGAEE